MKIKTGKKEAYEEFLREMDENSQKRARGRFLIQWLEMIEMDLESGETFSNAAKGAYDYLKEQFGSMTFDIPAHLKFITGTWEYGEQLKEWYNGTGCTKKKTGPCVQSTVCITKHARKRMHTRCGLNKKAQEKAALNAWEKGISIEDAGGQMQAYMMRVLDHTQDRAQSALRLYGDKIYVFKTLENCNLLVTTMQVPNKFMKQTTRHMAAAM